MKKYLILVIFATLVKMIGLEGAFALNFTKFSYHNFFGGEPLGIFLSLLLMFFVHLCFYSMMVGIIYLIDYKKEVFTIYFVEGLAISIIETAFYNLGGKSLIDTLPSFLNVILFNIILSYTINISVKQYKGI